MKKAICVYSHKIYRVINIIIRLKIDLMVPIRWRFIGNWAAAEKKCFCLPGEYPSVFYQKAIWPVNWTQGHEIGWCKKNGGRLGQCLWSEVTGQGPLTTHIKAGLTHPASSEWESLWRALSNLPSSAHYRAKWPNAAFDAKQTQWLAWPIRLLLFCGQNTFFSLSPFRIWLGILACTRTCYQ